MRRARPDPCARSASRGRRTTPASSRLSRLGSEHDRSSSARRRRRLGPAGLLRGRCAARLRGPAGRGGHDRAAADAVGARPARRRARPSRRSRTVSRAFEKIAARPASASSATSSSVATCTPDDLTRLYDAVVYTVGAQTDRHLGIPGEDLPGSWPATAFVAWYNGHPDFQDLQFDLSGERAVVIGNGNVAVDVARMLALTARGAGADRHDRRRRSRRSRLRAPRDRHARPPRTGRRRAFTPRRSWSSSASWRGADVVVDPAELELDPASAAELEAGPAMPAAERRRPARVRRRETDRQAEDARTSASASRPSRSSATTGSRRSRSSGTSSSRTDAEACAPCRPRSAR